MIECGIIERRPAIRIGDVTMSNEVHRLSESEAAPWKFDDVRKADAVAILRVAALNNGGDH